MLSLMSDTVFSVAPCYSICRFQVYALDLPIKDFSFYLVLNDFGFLRVSVVKGFL